MNNGLGKLTVLLSFWTAKQEAVSRVELAFPHIIGGLSRKNVREFLAVLQDFSPKKNSLGCCNRGLCRLRVLEQILRGAKPGTAPWPAVGRAMVYVAGNVPPESPHLRRTGWLRICMFSPKLFCTKASLENESHWASVLSCLFKIMQWKWQALKKAIRSSNMAAGFPQSSPIYWILPVGSWDGT